MTSLVAITPAGAQALRAGPDPAIEALDFYVGNWNQTGTTRRDPRSDYRPLTGSESCSWVDGKTAVVCREMVSDGSGTSDTLYMLSWDRAGQRYLVQGTDYATGAVINGTGTLSGGVWFWDLVQRTDEDRTVLRLVFEPGDGGARRLTVGLDDASGTWPTIRRITYTRTVQKSVPTVRRSMIPSTPQPSAAPRSFRPAPAPEPQAPAGKIPVPGLLPSRDARSGNAEASGAKTPIPVPKLLPAKDADEPGGERKVPVPKLLPAQDADEPKSAAPLPVPKLLPAGEAGQPESAKRVPIPQLLPAKEPEEEKPAPRYPVPRLLPGPDDDSEAP
ncbi:hypothetical protein [Novosphingobium sp. PC22D]|uniref:hypothetical protein n=1 Tax=Novosphingobium sp. PC22D TaxID=1962403 RepID=UPI0011452D73|nr:hypothetical protein [Novosphingobium sp. PC22D]